MARPAKPLAERFEDDVILDLIARTEKGEPLTSICEDKRMPTRQAVYGWMDSDEAFALRFREARARGVHALAEGCLAIADKKAKDAVEVADKRVRIDTRLRLAGKWLPSIYGDKVVNTHEGPNGGPIPVLNINMTPEQVMDIYRKLAG